MAELRFSGRDAPTLPVYLNPNIHLQHSPDDPTPAIPEVSKPIYLLASVQNTGKDKTIEATVRFYICNPTTVMKPSNSQLVGTSNVVLAPTEVKDTLCVSPWKPSWINGGHVCAVCEVSALNDPSPFTAASIWDIGDRHVAQHNLNIVPGPQSLKIPTIVPFGVMGLHNTATHLVTVRPATPAEFKAVLGVYGAEGVITNDVTHKSKVTLQQGYSCGQELPRIDSGNAKIDMGPLEAGEEWGAHAFIKLPDDADAASAALFFVEQRNAHGEVIGGIAINALGGPMPKIPVRDTGAATKIPVSIPHRPYSTIPGCGLMTTDGLFMTNIGVQDVNVDTRNDGSTILDNASAYIEGFSDPKISVPHMEISSPLVQPAGSFKSAFPANFARATPGETLVSLIVQQQQGAVRKTTRIVKKIFVLNVKFNPATRTASAKIPQGTLSLQIEKVIAPENPPCQCEPDKKAPLQPMLIKTGSLVITPDPSYAGSLGPVPFNDPWWKVVGAAIILVLASFIATNIDQSGSTSVVIEPRDTFGEVDEENQCPTCNVQAHTNNFWSAVVITLGVVGAFLACLADDADLHERGQIATSPNAGELTTSERAGFDVKFDEAPAPGTPFHGSISWSYSRGLDSGRQLRHSKVDTWRNAHHLDNYKVTVNGLNIAPAIYFHDRRQPLNVQAGFIKPGRVSCRGTELYVTAQLWNEQGESVTTELRDDGSKTRQPNTGEYDGTVDLSRKESGRWYLYVIAQDVNTVLEGTEPRVAAKTVGGLILTKQLALGLNEKPCEFQHDAVVVLV